MTRNLIAAALVLTTLSAIPLAAEAKTAHGVIQFVGSLSRGPCELSATDWYQHAGRHEGISPSHAGPVQAPGNVCAGIADTSSIRVDEVAAASSTTPPAKVVVVTFN
ncbi:hypothetical protein ID144_25845 [Pseudomonas sp. JM0905a]|uniref:hypothetical protein n=1 Tax=Pseudomonas sp. JM0905a TaxID=2772484 RepID=UPI0016833DAD|nr:hypothetical protein [Pseudomonas sp. JM0905a]MBD2840473.1 hypothetical protein [Pseudomonas sp. JM0905a]